MKVYKVVTSFMPIEIKEEECKKANKDTIFFKDSKVERVSSQGDYFDDYESAVKYALGFAERCIDHHKQERKREIEYANKRIVYLETFIKENTR